MTRHLDDPNEVEFLAFGYGIPPEPVLTHVRRLYWHLNQQGLRLPAERNVIVIEGGRP